MSRLKKRLLQSVSAMLLALGVVATAALPAQAVTWYTYDAGGCGTFNTYICDVQYTGSWPTGQVRGVGQRNVYLVALQSSTTGTGNWVTVATTYPGSGGSYITPTVQAGKYNWYHTCFKLTSGGTLWCNPRNGPVYLGD